MKTLIRNHIFVISSFCKFKLVFSSFILCNRVKVLISNDLICEVHSVTMKVVDDENVNLEKMGEFWFCGIKSFHEGFPFSLKSTNSPFHEDFKPYMYFVVCLDGTIMAYIQW